MNEADRRIERLLVDRKPRVLAVAEHPQHLRSASASSWHRDDVGARHGDVFHLEAGEFVQVDDHLARAALVRSRGWSLRGRAAFALRHPCRSWLSQPKSRLKNVLLAGTSRVSRLSCARTRCRRRPVLAFAHRSYPNNGAHRAPSQRQYGVPPPPRLQVFSRSKASMRAASAVVLVVVAEQMQHPVHHEMRDMIGQARDPRAAASARAGLVGERHVAEQDRLAPRLLRAAAARPPSRPRSPQRRRRRRPARRARWSPPPAAKARVQRGEARVVRREQANLAAPSGSSPAAISAARAARSATSASPAASQRASSARGRSRGSRQGASVGRVVLGRAALSGHCPTGRRRRG
jgi:hypothetical protein